MNLNCMACGEKTDHGPTVADAMRPLCLTHWEAWGAGGEGKRWLKQPTPAGETEFAMYARAFMDWLSRVRAERRNGASA